MNLVFPDGGLQLSSAQPNSTRQIGSLGAFQISATPSPSLTPTRDPNATDTPTPLPTAAVVSFATNTPLPTATASSVPSPTPFPTTEPTIDRSGPTWTPPPRDPAVEVQDHYYFRRPTSSTAVNWVDRTYPYGSTSGGRLQVHHGVEFVNPRGTPVYAVAAGTVIHAGDDLSMLFGPSLNYYGNLVVIQHDFSSPEGLPVFTLYGHLDRVGVQTGQRVEIDAEIGVVGATGIAMGPHLHFEVRVGDPYDFGSTRNPELWIRPFTGFGTLAGLVTDAAGNRLYDVTLTVESTDIRRYAFSYASDSVNSDPIIGENFVLGDLPANYYTVTVAERGRVRFREIVYVYPNRTTFISVRLN
ncbi:MAG: M23 family metallopeptidase [Anaerolinea sp.]|nr:M23 family metallopeptidase [Anaerolinea sp.]